MNRGSRAAQRPAYRPGGVTRAKHTTARPRAARRHNRQWVGWTVTAVLAAAVIVGVVVGGRSSTVSANGTAPSFRLASTAGGSVSLADYQGRNVLLYFNEGVGCDACFYQMVMLEVDGSLTKEGVTVLPVVANSLGEVQSELRRYNVKTPYLVDPDSSVSRAYKVLGTGHHANLPGHSFVLVDGIGRIRWRGDYPEMWVKPEELAATVQTKLASS